MFYFGSPEDTADLFLKESLNGTGPAIPECHWDEMTEQDLLNAFTYLYRAVKLAYQGDAEDAVLEILVAQYDEAFEALAGVSERFRDAVRTGRHRLVLGVTREQVDKYRKLAGV